MLNKRAMFALCGLSVGASLALNTGKSIAADHQEAPGATAQLAADIGDYYAWHDEGQLNLVLTFGTFSTPGTAANYNRDVLYGFHFDTSSPADGVSDVDIYARFAQDASGAWGLQVSGVGDAPLQGAVETVLSNNQLSAWAGLADDPFFFDQSGFVDTVSTGTLSFDPQSDDVAGLNVTAIVIQVATATIQSEGTALQTWSTTASL